MGNKKAIQTINEAMLWKYTAKTAPFAALSVLFFLEIFGWRDLYSKAVVIIGTVFLTVSVCWWWWAVNKILNFSRMINETDDSLKEIKKIKENITSIKKNSNASNR